MNKSLRIGTLVGGQDAVRVIPQIMQHGFESFNLTFWQTTGDLDLAETAKRVREIVDEQGIVISAVSVFATRSQEPETTPIHWQVGSELSIMHSSLVQISSPGSPDV